jgi:glycerol kinase
VSSGALLGIDEGTTAVKAALFDLDLRLLAESRREVPVAHPRPGWVEQDPELILEAVVDAVAEVLERAGERTVVAGGLDHQGESVLAWNAEDGRPLTPVIVWQDKRQGALLARIGEGPVTVSGLPLDPYFSAGKLAWLIENEEPVRSAAAAGSLRMGTVDSFLCDRLGGGWRTDLSTASRTQLIAPEGRDWDEGLLGVFGIGREWLPPIGPSFGTLGELRSARWPVAVPLAAQLVDQQAALAGSGAVRPGELKASYGTGVFVLGRTEGPAAGSGLLPTVAWASPEAMAGSQPVAHALDGGVFAAGSLLRWLAQGLGLAEDVESLVRAAGVAGESGGAMVLPALAGLGAPWWKPSARAVIAGLHPGISAGNVAWAGLEAIAWRVADIVEAMETVTPASVLRVDGGLTRSEHMLRIRADALDVPVQAGAANVTVLGAAMLAGVGAGVFESVEQAAGRLPRGRLIAPASAPGDRARDRSRWKAFVQASASLA